MDIIFDIETDGLLKDGTKIHCMAWRTVDDPTVHTEENQDNARSVFLHWLSVPDTTLIGHNIQGFDIPFLKKVTGLEWDGRIFDTLVVARLLYPDIKFADLGARAKRPDFPKELIGRHSLEAWGYRLNKLKGDFAKKGEWEEFCPEMLEYCIQDVKVTAALYEHLRNKTSPESLELEHQFSAVLDKQMARGVGFDVRAAEDLYAEIKVAQVTQTEAMKGAFPPYVKRTQLKTKVKEEVIPFNPTSRAQIARGFKEKYGWQATKLTPQGAPQVDEDVLSNLDYPEAPGLLRLMLLTKRLGQLSEGNQSLLSHVQDGRIYGYINHNGAVTGRCIHSHPNLGQIPAARRGPDKQVLRGEDGGWGYEFRALFIPREGWAMVGADASGLELRCLAHYMARYDNGAYRDVLLEGDIHTENQAAAGLPTRDQAKTFIYAFLYGAGAEKLGSIVGGGRKEGIELKSSFLSKLPALKRLIIDVQDKAERVGYLCGLDGRTLKVRSKHSALNTLLQHAGAIVMKKAVVHLDFMIANAGFHELAHQVLMVHDEVQLETEPSVANEVGSFACESIAWAGEHFKLRCPMAGEYRVGKSWAETH